MASPPCSTALNWFLGLLHYWTTEEETGPTLIKKRFFHFILLNKSSASLKSHRPSKRGIICWKDCQVSAIPLKCWAQIRVQVHNGRIKSPFSQYHLRNEWYLVIGANILVHIVFSGGSESSGADFAPLIYFLSFFFPSKLSADRV